MKQAQKKPPLPPNLPHLAYILLWFPLFTQPFIFREVKCLQDFLPVEVYTLYGKNSRFWSGEMHDCDIRVNRLGMRAVFTIIFATVRNFCLSPVKMCRLFRKCLLKRWGSLEILGENVWAFFAGAYLARRFREDGIDLIYAPWPRGAATAARVASSLCGIPYIIAARGDNLDPADPDLEDKFAESILVRTNNAADQERIEKFGNGVAKGKTCLVYNSLTLPEAAPEKSAWKYGKDLLTLLAVGRFDVTKGFDILLEACAILKKRAVRFRLTLAGGGGKVMGLGNLEKYLRDLRDRLGLESQVDMPGLVSHDELPGLLASHDIFVAPCVIHESGRRDGIPNTVIEAMAFGLPVIGTNINALPEVILHQKTGLLAPPADPQALADAIMKLAENAELAASMGANGIEHARRLFDCRQNACKLAAAFIAVWKNHSAETNNHC